jgi:hypothetical protein
MIIKAKYPKTYRWYMRDEEQGFGSLYGGNQISDVENNNASRDVEETHDSDFPQ